MNISQKTIEYGISIRNFYREHLKDEVIQSAPELFSDTSWYSPIAEKYMISDREGERFYDIEKYRKSLNAYEWNRYFDETYIAVITPRIKSKLAILKITLYKNHKSKIEYPKDIEDLTPILLEKYMLFNKPITIPRKTYEYFENQLKRHAGIDIDTLKKVFFIISLFEPNIVGYYGEDEYGDMYGIFDKYFKKGDLKKTLKKLKYEFINLRNMPTDSPFIENYIASENFDLFGYGVKGIADKVFRKVREYNRKNLIVFDDDFLIEGYVTLDEFIKELEKDLNEGEKGKS